MSNKINTNTKIKQIFSKYVDIDDQIKNKNKEINVLKKQRKTLELFIIDYLKVKIFIMSLKLMKIIKLNY